jgi:2-polyprenyl-3-methyl-5-hydroxy-6-metoxy-1,4-benzoquinol methylase
MSYRGAPYDSDFFIDINRIRPEGYTDYRQYYQKIPQLDKSIIEYRADDIEASTGLVAGKDVIVYGCAYGYLANELQIRGATVTAIDISNHAITTAQASYPNVTFVEQDVLDNYGSPNSFDLSICCDIIGCLNNDTEVETFFEAADRSLRNNGKLYMLSSTGDVEEVVYLIMNDSSIYNILGQVFGGSLIFIEDVGHLPVAADTRAVVT